MKTTTLLAFLSATLVSTCFAQQPPAEKPSDETSKVKDAVAANDRAYEAAYNKADVKALADFFSDDAEYTSDDGQTFSGRAEIEKAIQSAFTTNKGAKLTIGLDSVRVLAPEVVLE